MSSPSNAEPKSFILTHMNEDHGDSLALYLRHYANVAPADACTARMEDITLKDMTISHTSGSRGERIRTTVNFDPPLATLTESHIRLVQMSYAGSAAVGESPFRVRKFTLPTLQGWASIIGVGAGVYMLLRPSVLAQTGFLTRTLFRGTTAIPSFLAQWRQAILGTIAAIHVTEATFMYRLAWKHCPRRINILRQESMGWVGWLWVISCFAEGAWCFPRFQGLVKQEEAKHKRS